MDETLAAPISVAELAAFVDLSPSRLARLFRQEVGMTPARYLHQLRLARARVLLERTSLTVRQIMACVGLDDAAGFAHDFHREHGLDPHELRQLRWTGRVAAYGRPFPPHDN
jgi:AraC family transcriptional regulator of arabinose operon